MLVSNVQKVDATSKATGYPRGSVGEVDACSSTKYRFHHEPDLLIACELRRIRILLEKKS